MENMLINVTQSTFWRNLYILKVEKQNKEVKNTLILYTSKSNLHKTTEKEILGILSFLYKIIYLTSQNIRVFYTPLFIYFLKIIP